MSSFKKDQNEANNDYITKTEDLQFNLSQVNDALGKQMFLAIFLKGRWKKFENFRGLVKLTKEIACFGEVKKDLFNFYTDGMKPRG